MIRDNPAVALRADTFISAHIIHEGIFSCSGNSGDQSDRRVCPHQSVAHEESVRATRRT